MPKLPESSQYKNSEEFKKRIAALMDDNECRTAKEFAALVSVSEPVISKAKNYGIVPGVRVLIRIADRLSLSLLYLLGKEQLNEFIPSASPSSFHIRIDGLTKERGLNYGQIATKMPFPRTYIYEWIKEGTYPSLDYALMLADYFNVSLDYLFGRTDYRH